VAAALAVLISSQPFGQTGAKFENFTATTTGLAVGGGETLRFNVSLWTPPAERAKLAAALEQGQEAFLDTLKGAAAHGYIWTSESLGYTLRYAHKMPMTTGGERIILAADRPLGAWSRNPWKAAGAGDTTLPFVVIELRLNREGRGEGKMSLAAKVGADRAGGTIALEAYETAPVLLRQATRVVAPY
jgi:hypothetical protein